MERLLSEIIFGVFRHKNRQVYIETVIKLDITQETEVKKHQQSFTVVTSATKMLVAFCFFLYAESRPDLFKVLFERTYQFRSFT